MLSKYREVCRQSVNLMNRCMAIRRQASELYIATRLSRAAIAITIRQQQRQQQAHQHRERLRCFDVAPQHWNTLQQNDRYIPPAAHRKESPSPRESQVLRLVAEGKSNKQIGADLHLSTRTIETYRARLMTKLKMHSAAELIRYAVRNNLVQV